MTCGAPRLLDIVGDLGVPCGTYASGIIAEKWPELLCRIDDTALRRSRCGRRSLAAAEAHGHAARVNISIP